MGDTKKGWLLILMHMFAWFLNLKKFIHQVNIGTKWSLHKHPRAVCQADIISCTKWTHLKNSKVRGSLERWPNDDHFLSFWVLADTFPQRESAKMATLLVRNYSFFIAADAAFSSAAGCSVASATSSFQSLAHFMSTNIKPSGTIGDTKKRWPFQSRPFGRYNRFSPFLI